jgi:protein-disulfide isomerase-like protein with CxxC motif
MREVEKVRPVDVTWKFLSLEEINKPHDTVRPGHVASRRTFRTMALARKKYGNEAVGKLYKAFGEARFDDGKDLGEEPVVREAIRAAGFDDSLLDEALADPSTAETYVSEHAAIAEKGGFGVASLVIEGSAPVFGPVINPVPKGEEAGELWDHVAAMSTKGYFFELKRPR